MKKIKLFATITSLLVGGGLLSSIPLILASCSKNLTYTITNTYIDNEGGVTPDGVVWNPTTKTLTINPDATSFDFYFEIKERIDFWEDSDSTILKGTYYYLIDSSLNIPQNAYDLSKYVDDDKASSNQSYGQLLGPDQTYYLWRNGEKELFVSNWIEHLTELQTGIYNINVVPQSVTWTQGGNMLFGKKTQTIFTLSLINNSHIV